MIVISCCSSKKLSKRSPPKIGLRGLERPSVTLANLNLLGDHHVPALADPWVVVNLRTGRHNSCRRWVPSDSQRDHLQPWLLQNSGSKPLLELWEVRGHQCKTLWQIMFHAPVGFLNRLVLKWTERLHQLPLHIQTLREMPVNVVGHNVEVVALDVRIPKITRTCLSRREAILSPSRSPPQDGNRVPLVPHRCLDQHLVVRAT